MIAKPFLSAILLALALGVCQAASAQGSDQSQAAAAQPQDPEPAAAVASSAPETGRIIFFRPKKMMGAAIVFKIREGDDVLGKLSSGSFFVVDVPVGTHHYYAKSEGRDDALVLEIEPGETYYVQGGMAFGLTAGNSSLAPSDQAAFDEANKKKLKDRTGEKVD